MNKKNIGKVVVPVVLIIAFALFVAQQKSKQSVPVSTVPSAEETKTILSEEEPSSQKITAKAQEEKPAPAPVQKLPRLIDLGAKSCVPCKMMAPILEELQNEYKGKLQVEFIDVWENQSAGDQYGIRVIPTQIFFDPSGKELFRHAGFMSKEDILTKWKELGFTLTATP